MEIVLAGLSSFLLGSLVATLYFLLGWRVAHNQRDKADSKRERDRARRQQRSTRRFAGTGRPK